MHSIICGNDNATPVKSWFLGKPLCNNLHAVRSVWWLWPHAPPAAASRLCTGRSTAAEFIRR